MSKPPDHELLTAWRDGDAESGDTLLRRHFRSIFAFFGTKAPDHTDELVQATFLACVEGRDRIDETRNFRAYLFGIARRQLIYHYRKSQRDKARFDPLLESVHDMQGSLSQGVGLKQEHELLVQVLQQLPLDLQIGVELHYWEGLSVAEVGDALQVPAGTVKSRLHRAREMLRERLDALGASRELGDAVLARLRRQSH